MNELLVLTSVTAGASGTLLVAGLAGSGTLRRPVRATTTATSPHMLALREKASNDSPVFALVIGVLPWLTPIVRRLPLRGLKTSVGAAYARAGWPGGLDDDEVLAYGFMIGGFFSLFIAAGLSILMPGPWMAISLVTIPLGPLLLASTYRSAAQTRAKKIRRTIPYVLDLLVMALRSGSSLIQAMERVAQDYANHPVGEEFSQALTELDLGTSRREVFEAMAGRVDLPEVDQFVDCLLQAEELGRPLAASIERLAGRVRMQRVQDAESTAGAAGVNVMLPSTLLFVANLILLLGPFMLRLMAG